MLLSVVSALTRLNVDPWQEASSLAELPVGIATERLASLLKMLPGMLSTHAETGTIAERLIALLPTRSNTKINSRRALSGVSTMTRSSAVVYVILFVLALIAGTQFMGASHQSPSPREDASSPAASGTSHR